MVIWTVFALFLMVSSAIMLAAGPQTSSNSTPPKPSSAVLGNAHSAGQPLVGPHLRIAVVKPVFTATAYASYYDFYRLHAGITNGMMMMKDLSLLNTTLVDSWGWSDGLHRFLSSGAAGQYGLTMGKNLWVLTDVEVSAGALFKSDGTSNYDILILGFTEYVTSQEYHAYQQFVGAGGTMIFMDAGNFLAEVKYYPQSHHLALSSGHSWGFDGAKAWRDKFARWGAENTKWVGSNYCGSRVGNRHDGALLSGENPIALALTERFGPRVFMSYGGHEENCVTNTSGTVILARWPQTTPGSPNMVAAYMHHYLKGTVVHLGVMGSDVIASDKSVQSFLISSILFAENSNSPPRSR
jgi:hypothetical protein